MNLRDLRYIVAVADNGHFGKAAMACAVSQPTLSGQILKLERELGIELFDRFGRIVQPTAAGVAVIDHARIAVTAADDVLAAAAQHRDPRLAPLRLGIIPTLAPYLMPIVLPIMRETMPGLRLMLVEDLTSRIIDPVLRGELDAALIASQSTDGALRDELIFEEPFWLILPADHPLADQQVVAASALDAASLLLLRDGHCFRDQALALCRRTERDGSQIADMRATSFETLLHMADAGYGLTLMPHLAVVRDVPLPGTLVARRLTGPETSRGVRMVSRHGSARRSVINRLVTVIADGVRDRLRDGAPAS